MGDEAIREKVREIVGELAPLKGQPVTSSARLVVDLGFDSLGLLECIGAIEQEFGLPDIDESELAVETLGEVEQLVVNALAKRPHAEIIHAR
jgi:acyl carrier protein